MSNDPQESYAPSTQQAQQAPAPAPYPAQQPAMSDPRRKSPFLAGMLSAMPGLGQVYVGYYKRGFIHVLVVASLIALLASGELGGLIPLAGLFLAFFWLYNVVDATRRAALYNQMLEGGSSIELPEDFQPGLGGSIAGGATLMAIGFLLLAHTRLGMSLEFLEDWWPLALVLFGGYLLYKAIQEKSAGTADQHDD